ncbi:MAG TPA: hypothetical protein VMD47_09125 [Candidatus Acidoferrales bacterium]|nr:hypothetical protein [Candidatus Acidoferrales bacterium]
MIAIVIDCVLLETYDGRRLTAPRLLDDVPVSRGIVIVSVASAVWIVGPAPPPLEGMVPVEPPPEHAASASIKRLARK